MSRKSDIERGLHWMWCEDKWESIAKRLRAKVRKMLEESK